MHCSSDIVIQNIFLVQCGCYTQVNKKDMALQQFFVFVELIFLETSALTGENVEESFLKCSRTILNKIESGLFSLLLLLAE